MQNIAGWGYGNSFWRWDKVRKKGHTYLSKEKKRARKKGQKLMLFFLANSDYVKHKLIKNNCALACSTCNLILDDVVPHRMPKLILHQVMPSLESMI